MPIDSLCTGCGRTLRVDDEFAGRKARCPMCGLVYIVGESAVSPPIATPLSPTPIDETTYSPADNTNDALNQPLADSWSSLPTSSSQSPFPTQQPNTQPPNTTPERSFSETLPGQAEQAPPQPPINAEPKFFVRTPNSMIYGPSDKTTVLEWIEQGRLDDTCHIRLESSEQWLGLAAWRFQTRKVNVQEARPAHPTAGQFGEVPKSNVQSAGYAKSGNGTMILVLGLVSWLLCPTAIGGWICAILAIVFASFEFNKIRDGQSPSSERWLVLIGMWLGIAHLVAWVLSVIGLIIISIVSN